MANRSSGKRRIVVECRGDEALSVLLEQLTVISCSNCSRCRGCLANCQGLEVVEQRRFTQYGYLVPPWS